MMVVFAVFKGIPHWHTIYVSGLKHLCILTNSSESVYWLPTIPLPSSCSLEILPLFSALYICLWVISQYGYYKYLAGPPVNDEVEPMKFPSCWCQEPHWFGLATTIDNDGTVWTRFKPVQTVYIFYSNNVVHNYIMVWTSLNNVFWLSSGVFKQHFSNHTVLIIWLCDQIPLAFCKDLSSGFRFALSL